MDEYENTILECWKTVLCKNKSLRQHLLNCLWDFGNFLPVLVFFIHKRSADDSILSCNNI